jgi:hypothetical protein
MGRFIAAIVVFAVALVFLGTGIAFKIFAGPRSVSESVTLAPTAKYAVVDASVVNVRPGLQTVVLSGGKTNVVAYGRTIDVLSWIGESPYLSVTRSATGTISSKLITPEVTEGAPTPTILNPDGSDMWLEHNSGDASASLAMNLPAEMSVILSSDGVDPVSPTVAIVWPLSLPTFLWMQDDQLLFLGGGITLVGVALYLWALANYRAKQGPRRKTPKPPRPRKISHSPHRGIRAERTRGRRAGPRRTAFIALPIAAFLSLGLASCASPFQTGSGVSTPTPTSTQSNQQGLDLPPVSVTETQMRVIMANLADVAAQADANLDPNLASTRFAGAALDARRANYAIRKADSGQPAIGAIPTTAPSLFLPEATNSWPRSLFAVYQPVATDVKTEKDAPAETAPTIALILQQVSPRDNYKIIYQTSLQANQTVPEVAAANVGTVEVQADSKLLLLPPNQVAAAYADVLANGDTSSFNEDFESTGDSLRAALQAERALQNADNVSVSYSDRAGTGPVVAMASVTAGALVSVSVEEIARFEPQGGRSLKLTGGLKALGGTELAPKPVNATYQFELLFFVPAIGSAQKISLVGYAENLTKVSME